MKLLCLIDGQDHGSSQVDEWPFGEYHTVYNKSSGLVTPCITEGNEHLLVCFASTWYLYCPLLPELFCDGLGDDGEEKTPHKNP